MIAEKNVAAIAIFLVALFACFTAGFAGEKGPDIPADEALNKLMAGNIRFSEGKQVNKPVSGEKTGLAKERRPFAVIANCSAPQVPAEEIFDQRPGDIFIANLCGKTICPFELCNVQYGIEHFGVPLVFVLGQPGCGTATATTGSPGEKKQEKDAANASDETLTEHVKFAVKILTQQNAAISRLVESKKVKIVAGIFNPATRKVEMVDTAADE